MSKKMYYTEAEACTKLHVGLAELTNLVRDQKLRVFMDGAKKMFKVADVDALSGPASSEDIELAPAEGGADAVSLSEADVAKPPTKEDTVITAEGISIFDDEDLQIESADPMAKTQIAPSIEDQTSLEGVGSGSGLLDLTRESDDTSLGAEVLDHIDMTGEVGSGIGSEVAEPVAYQPPQEVMVVEQAGADVMDASSGLFGGMAVGVSVVLLMLAAVAMAAMQSAEGGVAGFVEGMKNNIAIILVVSVVVVGIGAGAGFAMGKAVATRQAMKKIGA